MMFRIALLRGAPRLGPAFCSQRFPRAPCLIRSAPAAEAGEEEAGQVVVEGGEAEEPVEVGAGQVAVVDEVAQGGAEAAQAAVEVEAAQPEAAAREGTAVAATIRRRTTTTQLTTSRAASCRNFLHQLPRTSRFSPPLRRELAGSRFSTPTAC